MNISPQVSVGLRGFRFEFSSTNLALSDNNHVSSPINLPWSADFSWSYGNAMEVWNPDTRDLVGFHFSEGLNINATTLGGHSTTLENVIFQQQSGNNVRIPFVEVWITNGELGQETLSILANSFDQTTIYGKRVWLNESRIIIEDNQRSIEMPFHLSPLLAIAILHCLFFRDLKHNLTSALSEFEASHNTREATKKIRRIEERLQKFEGGWLLKPEVLSGYERQVLSGLFESLNVLQNWSAVKTRLAQSVDQFGLVDEHRAGLFSKISAFLLVPLSIATFLSVDPAVYLGAGLGFGQKIGFVVVVSVLSVLVGFLLWHSIRVLTDAKRYEASVYIGIVFALLAAILSGAGMIFVKYFITQGISSATITFTSYLYSSIIFLSGLFLVNARLPNGFVSNLMTSKHFWVCGVTGGYFLLAYYHAVNYVPASLAEVFASLGPIGTYLVIRIFYKEKIASHVVLVSALLLASTYLVVFGFTVPKFGWQNAFLVGFLFSIIGVLISAFFKASQKYVPVNQNKLGEAVAFVALYGLVSASVLVPVVGIEGFQALAALDLNTHLVLAVSAIREGFAWLFLFLAIRLMNAFHANVIQNYAFVVTVGLDYLIFETLLPTGSYVGVILLMVIMVIVGRDVKYDRQN